MSGFKAPQNANKVLSTLIMSYNSLGAIYGDIGTSPLYTVSSIITEPPVDDEVIVLRAISCVFWLFTIIVICKYALIVLTFGPNNNEGGQIAIYSKIARTLHIGPVGVTIPGGKKTEQNIAGLNDDNLLALTRTNTRNSGYSDLVDTKMKAFLSKFTIGLCFLGCSLVFSDGLLTPTTSVLSAIAGIAVAKPSFEDKVMPVSCGVLICLFLIQRFGSGKLSLLFSPVIFIWLIILFVDGCVCIAKHPGIMRALSPHHAIMFLVDDGGVDAFAPIMLSITGAEAMFADVAHFGPLPVQLTLGFFVYPCLIVCYLGQGAYLIKNPESVSNLFYESIPFGGVGSSYYWFVFTLSTLATIIASQALILGVFAIIKQLIILDCFPRLTLVHTSSKHTGKVYIPVVNYVLMVLVVVTTVCFKNSNNVTAAYGLGIAIDFLVTSILISLCLYYVYHVNIVVVLAYFIPFGALEACLIVAGLKKVPHGAWAPLMITAICFLFISTWRWYRSLKINKEIDSKRSIDDLFDNRKVKKDLKEAMVLNLGEPRTAKLDDADNDSIASEVLENDDDDDEVDNTQLDADNEVLDFHYQGKVTKVKRTPKVYLMYSAAASTNTRNHYLPNLFEHIVNSFGSVPKIFILIETRVSTYPFIDDDDPKAAVIKVEEASVSGFYRCIIRSGFMKQTRVDRSLLREILLQVDALDELLEYYGVDDPFSINGDLNIPVVNIFERDLVTSKKLTQHMEEDLGVYDREGQWNLKKIFMAPFWYVRENIINFVLSPFDGALNSNSLDFIVADDLKVDRENHESIFISNRTYV